jgi:hypothetical protein
MQHDAPWVNPYPHNGHVDLVQPNGSHQYIGLGQSQYGPQTDPAVTEQQKFLGSLAIKGAAFHR